MRLGLLAKKVGMSRFYDSSGVNHPVTILKVDESNTFVDCIVTTKTGKKLATIQASHQFKLYTGLEFPL